MTSIVNLRRSRARLALVLLGLGMGWAVCLVAASRRELKPIRDHRDMTDYRFYRDVAARVGAGADYYDAAGSELRNHGFSTGSSFHWRTPLYAHALSWLGGPVRGQVGLAALATTAAMMGAILVARDCGRFAGTLAGVSVATASAWWVYPEPPYFTEPWAGLLILAAIASRALGSVAAAVATAAAALFLRELVLPFVGLCLVNSWARGRSGEMIAWALCLALYGLHMAMHVAAVASRQPLPPGEPVPGWVAFGGVHFLLATTRMNYVLSLLPDWWAAIYLPLAVFGLVALGARRLEARWMLIGMTGYLLAFAVVGKDFNDYWGWITSPTFAVGFAVAPFHLAGTIHRASRASG